ncbi:nuclear transport factor 2 family protein [Kitasatospora sp. LaBMicrA B282]|uniref:nuclear transport factor 2 family protein n=1 Tax=Kitasatospora sp. LaBMicrA B282 TaxID=3420949 RepID=UPI003D0FF41D
MTAPGTTTPGPSTVHTVLTRQLDALGRGDLDALLANYAADAELLRSDGVFRGPERIRAAFARYLALRPRLVELSECTESCDTLLYRAVLELGGTRKEAIGTMVIRNGKIWRQTAGVFDG